MITTEAPPKFLSSLKRSLAFCLSNKVFPKKVPRPKPEFEFNSNDLDLIYGSPNLFIMSLGNPGPSSLTCLLYTSPSPRD